MTKRQRRAAMRRTERMARLPFFSRKLCSASFPAAMAPVTVRVMSLELSASTDLLRRKRVASFVRSDTPAAPQSSTARAAALRKQTLCA